MLAQSEYKYSILLSDDSYERVENYASRLRNDATMGYYLKQQLDHRMVSDLTPDELLAGLIHTKQPQIFAESAVCGDGTDWTQEELGILGDVSIGMAVDVYDNGAHNNPDIHPKPFRGHLIYTPGALLRNDQDLAPADWREVVEGGVLNKPKYYGLYERRLRPAFDYINHQATAAGRRAFVTCPGIGCGQFAGPFQGQMGRFFQAALAHVLQTFGAQWPAIHVVYYDPYNECENERRRIGDIEFITRPLTRGNAGKSQLSHISDFGTYPSDDFSDCDLYSFVAWDHVSWPGNDYYQGDRVTDDGVKAAATNSMHVMTGFEGHYCPAQKRYLPPESYRNWNEVIIKNGLTLYVGDNVHISNSGV